MNIEDLRAALRPVRNYFGIANEVNEATVMAAYLRSQDGWATRQAIAQGLKLLHTGHSFEQAARLVMAQPNAPVRRAGKSRPVPPSPPPPIPTIPAKPRRALPDEAWIESAPEPDLPTGSTLDWFPKRNTSGDLNGDGAVRLLGTPNVPLSTVLVRETAQNSWDARLGHTPVRYSVNLRTLNPDQSQALDRSVLTGQATGLGLRERLAARPIRVLEISDRGTSGLDGPTRPDREVPAGASTNFIDLIFNIGAPRDVHLGAGTYGFGKTIAYRVSGARTVLFWSRSREGARLENRLIGSAFGKSFTEAGQVFTGRHWWGLLRDGGERVEPWTGNPAEDMAKSVFEARFQEEETGTSMMIIDPQLGGADDDEDLQRLADAIVWNLWPKLLATPAGRQPMVIELQHNSHQIELPDVTQHPLLQGFAEALQMVRAQQDQLTYSPRFDTRVIPIWLERPKTLLGHLALSRYPRPMGRQTEKRETMAIHGVASHVAWMRHDAELLVTYDERPRMESDHIQWAGVFKPTREVDDSFAQSEPPAHDDWMPQSIEDKARKREVNVAIRRMREQVVDFLRPTGVTASPTAQVSSVAALADSLASLVGAVPGSRPLPKQGAPSTSRAPASRKPRVVIHQQFSESSDETGRRRVMFQVSAEGGASQLALRAEANLAIEGGSLPAEGAADVLGWANENLDIVSNNNVFMTAPNQLIWLVISAETDAALDLTINVSEVD